MNEARRTTRIVILTPTEIPIVFVLGIFFSGGGGGGNVDVLIGGIGLQTPISN